MIATATIVVALPAEGFAVTAGSSISVSPSSVKSGGTVVISGVVPTSGEQSCLADNEVILTSDSRLFPPDGFGPHASRSTTGAFRVRYPIPVSTPPGTYDIGMRCGGGNIGITTSLRVTGQVQHIPSGAPPAGLGGAGTVTRTQGWFLAGATAAVLAAILASAYAWRRRRRDA